jgi:prolyl 4-hydroxylase
MSQHQSATPELRQWILDQARAGHTPESVLKAMIASGWQEAVAVQTLEDTLTQFLAERQSPLPSLEPLPEPALQAQATTLHLHDRTVRVVMSMHEPRVVVLADFLSVEECEAMIAESRQRLERSLTVDVGTGGSEVNAARTSEGMFFSRGESPLIQRIEARLAALTQWPVENGEGLQVLRYQPGAEYKPHFDYFDPAQPGTPTILKRGGQRVATVVMYLNTPEQGGATTFPDVRLEVAAQRGHAVFFSYDRPDPSTRSLHGGAPVLAGEKWVATKWLRQGRFE